MKIAIVEDEPILLGNLKILLSSEHNITVVGAFKNAEAAIANLEEISPDIMPDIMIVDLGLPRKSGIELVREVKAKMPNIDILVYTVYEDNEHVFSALKAGASGYILKGGGFKELIEDIYNLYNGGAPMSPRIARKVINEFQTEVKNEEYILSPREKNIVTEIEKGLSYKEMADKFNISPHTVHTHIKNIYEKLHAKTRQEALLMARRKGII
ncbi:MAG: response regulator transcription factor [Deltaproteobacteria bacterium]|nr:response regulator transcription factor [Deltaproteobacteria bacterium]